MPEMDGSVPGHARLMTKDRLMLPGMPAPSFHKTQPLPTVIGSLALRTTCRSLREQVQTQCVSIPHLREAVRALSPGFLIKFGGAGRGPRREQRMERVFPRLLNTGGTAKTFLGFAKISVLAMATLVEARVNDVKLVETDADIRINLRPILFRCRLYRHTTQRCVPKPPFDCGISCQHLQGCTQVGCVGLDPVLSVSTTGSLFARKLLLVFRDSVCPRVPRFAP